MGALGLCSQRLQCMCVCVCTCACVSVCVCVCECVCVHVCVFGIIICKKKLMLTSNCKRQKFSHTGSNINPPRAADVQ